MGPLRQQEGSSGRPLQSTGKKEKRGSGWHPTPVGKRKKVLHGHTLPSAKKRDCGKELASSTKNHRWNHMIGSTSSRSGLVFTGQRMISITQTDTQSFSLHGTFSEKICQVKMRLDGTFVHSSLQSLSVQEETGQSQVASSRQTRE